MTVLNWFKNLEEGKKTLRIEEYVHDLVNIQYLWFQWDGTGIALTSLIVMNDELIYFFFV